jgi:hypothetical protein
MQICDHCNKIKIHFFHQSEGCSNSEATEHCGKKCSHSEQEQEEEDDSCCMECCSPEDKSKEILSEIYIGHTEQCCVSEFMYFKIKSSYVSPQHDKTFQFDIDYNNISCDLLWEEGKLLSCEIVEDKILPEKIPPLIPGGERFIIYSHQLLFYA